MSSCNQVTQSLIQETCSLSSMDTEAGEALSLAQKAYTMGSNLFSAGIDFAYENPYTAALIVVGIVVVGGILYATRETPLPDLQQTMKKVDELLAKGGYDQAEKVAGKYVNDLCKATKFQEGLPKAAINADLKEYLTAKVFSVTARTMTPEVKEKIVGNVIADTKKLICNAEKRIKADLSAGRLACFSLKGNETITEIKPLGDESHYEGKIPLKITFSDGTSIVYKPRSMLPEHALFDTSEGLFNEVGFGTYHVVTGYDKEDQEDYGYAEFIINNVDDPTNTVDKPADLEQYLEKLCLLDQIGLQLGLSDLHYKNVMTQDLDPKVIDAEVYLTPSDVPTGMWDGFSQGAGVRFKLTNQKEYMGTNRITFGPKFPQRRLFSYEMSKDNLQEIGIDRDEVLSRAAGSLVGLQGKIQGVKERLQELPGRFVFIDTKSLNDEMRMLDPTSEQSVDELVNLISRTFEDFEGYEFDESAVGHIREQIKRDAYHNDVPAFCHDSRTKEVLYNGVVIGRFVG